VQAGNDSVVLANNNLKLADLDFELLIGFVDGRGSFRDWSVKKIEVFDFFEHRDQPRIEVHLQEVIIISGQDAKLKLLFGIALNLGFPISDLGVFVLFNILVEGIVKLLSILEFFSFSDCRGETRKLVVSFLDSFSKAFGPG